MSGRRYEIGLVGLGVMGRNLLLNMADHGYTVAGFDKDPAKVKSLAAESADRNIRRGPSSCSFLQAPLLMMSSGSSSPI
jgi:6-phosphogluconate dehydrogenase